MDISEAKKEMRRLMRRRLAVVGTQEAAKAGRAVAAEVTTSAIWRYARRVLLFLSMEGEIDTGPLLASAFAAGKTVYLPRVEGRIMRFYRASSPDGPWTTGPFGLQEPPSSPEGAFRPEDAGRTLIVTPGLAFDRQGGRLGRGGGFYDRFFAALGEHAEAARLGICHRFQLVSQVPQAPLDQKVESVSFP